MLDERRTFELNFLLNMCIRSLLYGGCSLVVLCLTGLLDKECLSLLAVPVPLVDLGAVHLEPYCQVAYERATPIVVPLESHFKSPSLLEIHALPFITYSVFFVMLRGLVLSATIRLLLHNLHLHLLHLNLRLPVEGRLSWL